MSNIFEINDEIVEITYVGKKETIDIEVSGNRLFYANEILTHNSGLDEPEYGMGTIAGGLTKIYTADNAIGIHASRAMKERGRIQIEFMKTRSSGGEGKKIDLEYNTECMRITDLPDDTQQQSTPNTIYDKIKNKVNISEGDTSITKPVEKKIDTERLRNILKRTE
jgi:hypothetical protein